MQKVEEQLGLAGQLANAVFDAETEAE